MIRAEFTLHGDRIVAFVVEGHAHLAPAPGDILCAAVSAMTQLVINTLESSFHADLQIGIDEEKPRISAAVKAAPFENEEAVAGVLKGFYEEMCELEKQYPKHIAIRTNHKEKG